MDLLDDALSAYRIDLARLHYLETNVSIILIVRQPTESRPDTSMDIGIISEQTLHRSVVEVGSVVDAGNLGGCASEDLGLPGVEVRVEVDDGDGAVCFVHAPEQRESDGVVASEGDDTWEDFSVLGDADVVGFRCGCPHEDAVVAFFDLLEGPFVVVSASQSAVYLGCRLKWSTYEVTGISPQSITFAQLLNGFASSGTLYPPLKRTLREPPVQTLCVSLLYVLEIETAATLPDA